MISKNKKCLLQKKLIMLRFWTGSIYILISRVKGLSEYDFERESSQLGKVYMILKPTFTVFTIYCYNDRITPFYGYDVKILRIIKVKNLFTKSHDWYFNCLIFK